MKRRLQQLEDDNEKTNDVYENLITNNTEGASKPNFRFPIVSDHEIYGWEKELNHDEYTKDYLQQEPEDDYERVPLYQNTRWPGKFEQEGKIYRAESKPEFIQSARVVNSQPAKPQVEEKSLSFSVKEEKLKTPKRPFSPTQVPSPIYGYVKSSPILSAMEAAKLKRSSHHADDGEHSHEVDDAIVQELGISENQGAEELTEIQETPFEWSTETDVPVDSLLEEPEQFTDEVVEPVSEIVDAPHSLQEEVETNADEQLSMQDIEPIIDSLSIPADSDAESQSMTTEAHVVEETLVEKTDQTKDVRDQQSQVEGSSVKLLVIDEPVEIAESVQTEVEEIEAVSEEVMSVNEDEEEIEEHAEPQRKEKIVPFNVLMLQSDKEKLAAKKEQSSVNETLHTEVISTNSSVLEETVIETSEVEEEPLPSYGFPSLRYLEPPEEEIKDEEWLEYQSAKLEETLSYFSIQATVMQAVQGPAVTMFELTVEQGIKVSKIRNLTDDLKLALAARDIRIQAPIPGTSLIGVEIPNRQTRAVRISEVIESTSFKNSDSPLEAVLGLSLTGEPQTIDLRKMPHGMIAGATGSGKSVCINSLLISLLYKASYHDLKLLLIDPKMVELAPYNGIPHLLSPVITDVKAATAALKWAVEEMERRYELFAHSGVRNIERYNEMVMESRRFSLKMPYMLIVIDELADLMMMAPADVEISISRITQKARACGIHLIIATQRPSVDVITGTIKANIPTRIAFAVSSQVDSRTILDSVGAERLLGKGDMLYLGNGQSAPVRLQGTFVTDDEIERIIEHVRNEAEPTYLFGQEDLLATAIQEEETDPLFQQACAFIIEQGSVSTSLLQRHFSIGYNRAAKLIDRMEANQFISEQRGSKPRDVFLTEQAFESFMK